MCVNLVAKDIYKCSSHCVRYNVQLVSHKKIECERYSTLQWELFVAEKYMPEIDQHIKLLHGFFLSCSFGSITDWFAQITWVDSSISDVTLGLKWAKHSASSIPWSTGLLCATVMSLNSAGERMNAGSWAATAAVEMLCLAETALTATSSHGWCIDGCTNTGIVHQNRLPVL